MKIRLCVVSMIPFVLKKNIQLKRSLTFELQDGGGNLHFARPFFFNGHNICTLGSGTDGLQLDTDV